MSSTDELDFIPFSSSSSESDDMRSVKGDPKTRTSMPTEVSSGYDLKDDRAVCAKEYARSGLQPAVISLLWDTPACLAYTPNSLRQSTTATRPCVCSAHSWLTTPTNRYSRITPDACLDCILGNAWIIIKLTLCSPGKCLLVASTGKQRTVRNIWQSMQTGNH